MLRKMFQYQGLLSKPRADPDLDTGGHPGTYHPMHRSQRADSGPLLFRALGMRLKHIGKGCYLISLQPTRPEPLEKGPNEGKKKRQKEERET